MSETTPQQPDLNEIMRKAKEMQQKMQEAQDELARTEVIGDGGGLVKVTMTCRYDAKKVQLTDEAMKESREVIEDLIAAAINSCTRKIEEKSKRKLKELSESMGIPTDY